MRRWKFLSFWLGKRFNKANSKDTPSRGILAIVSAFFGVAGFVVLLAHGAVFIVMLLGAVAFVPGLITFSRKDASKRTKLLGGIGFTLGALLIFAGLLALGMGGTF